VAIKNCFNCNFKNLNILIMKGIKRLEKLTKFILALISFFMAIVIVTSESIRLTFSERMIVGGYFLFITLLCVSLFVINQTKDLKKIKS
tara:strand:- start:11660 stop:11926 length:267 start_codon:yes stop_codon:yes gene_type:complete